MDWSNLKAYAGAPDADDAFLQECWLEAVELVSAHVGPAAVPLVVLDRATLEVGQELYNRRNSPSGSSQFASFDGGATPVRGPRDPLTMVYPMLGKYMVRI